MNADEFVAALTQGSISTVMNTVPSLSSDPTSDEVLTFLRIFDARTANDKFSPQSRAGEMQKALQSVTALKSTLRPEIGSIEYLAEAYYYLLVVFNPISRNGTLKRWHSKLTGRLQACFKKDEQSYMDFISGVREIFDNRVFLDNILTYLGGNAVDAKSFRTHCKNGPNDKFEGGVNPLSKRPEDEDTELVSIIVDAIHVTRRPVFVGLKTFQKICECAREVDNARPLTESKESQPNKRRKVTFDSEAMVTALHCVWCGQQGHLQSDCDRKLKAPSCVRPGCSGAHWAADCPQVSGVGSIVSAAAIASSSGSAASTQGPVASNRICRNCGFLGDHDLASCPCCSNCGRFDNHDATSCRSCRRCLGTAHEGACSVACRVCGDSGHKFEDCRLVVQGTGRVGWARRRRMRPRSSASPPSSNQGSRSAVDRKCYRCGAHGQNFHYANNCPLGRSGSVGGSSQRSPQRSLSRNVRACFECGASGENFHVARSCPRRSVQPASSRDGSLSGSPSIASVAVDHSRLTAAVSDMSQAASLLLRRIQQDDIRSSSSGALSSASSGPSLHAANASSLANPRPFMHPERALHVNGVSPSS